jgi:hypothetical protein
VRPGNFSAACRAVAYGIRGVAYRDKGDMNHAIADLSKAIRLKPLLARAYHDRSVAKGDDYSRAIAEQRGQHIIVRAMTGRVNEP